MDKNMKKINMIRQRLECTAVVWSTNEDYEGRNDSWLKEMGLPTMQDSKESSNNIV